MHPTILQGCRYFFNQQEQTNDRRVVVGGGVGGGGGRNTSLITPILSDFLIYICRVISEK